MASEKDVSITAAGMRKRTVRGKKRMSELRSIEQRAEEKKWKAEDAASKKFGCGKLYKECRQDIRAAADKGDEYIRFTFSDFRGIGGGTVQGVSEVKNHFLTSTKAISVKL